MRKGIERILDDDLLVLRTAALVHEQPCADGAEPVGWQGAWGDRVHDDDLALGGAAMGGMIMALAEPTTVRVRPVDRRLSLVACPRHRTWALDQLEANVGARSRAVGCASTAAHVA